MANGEQPQTITQAVTKVANGLISVLPPAFVALIGLNVLFLGCVLLFLNAQMEQRLMLATKILDGCTAMQAKLVEREVNK